ncbi:hypothetical protein ON010_g2262 [Phytophthora cinnamomi]|nr:hypothetical protein ON010_g2262 [Phytophthora cinnamomi]
MRLGDQFLSRYRGVSGSFQASHSTQDKQASDSEQISGMMQRGILYALTVLPHDYIDPRGIDFVITKLKQHLGEKEVKHSASKWVGIWS